MTFYGRVAAAERLLNEATVAYNPIAIFGMFSGGHDSLTATSLASHHQPFRAAHINTKTGIEATRLFVHDTCLKRGWPLTELEPDAKEYEELVLTGGGFPNGPRAHNTMYYWLKQRQVRRLVKEAKKNPSDRVMLVTGIRNDESKRRMGADMSQPIHRIGAQVWVNPILDWTASDCGEYIEAVGLKRNPVVDLLHRSGECLCGALAHRDEIKAIDYWYPEEAARIHALEAKAQALDLPSQRWATPTSRSNYKQAQALALCGSCQLNWIEEVNTAR